MAEKTNKTTLDDADLLSPAVLAHELRSPLGAIKGFASLISEEAYGPIADVRYIAAAQQMELAAQHMEHLVETVLGAAQRGVVGAAEVDRQDVDLTALVEDVQAWLRSKIVKAKVVVRARVLLEPIWVSGDAQRLRQALLNVLDNAIRYTPESGHVDVSIERRNDGGIDVRVVNDVRSARPRQDNESTSLSGQGLGLYITRAQMRAHGGGFVLSPGEDGRAHAVLSLPPERAVR